MAFFPELDTPDDEWYARTRPPAPASTTSSRFFPELDTPDPELEDNRTLFTLDGAFALVNDFMIDAANAAVGLAKAGVDVFAPGSGASISMGEFIQGGQEDQSDYRQALRKRHADLIEQAQAKGDTGVMQVLENYLSSPAILAAEALGNAGPFAALGRVGAAVGGAKAGLGATTAAGAAVSAGGTRGGFYDEIQQADDAKLLESSPLYLSLRQTLSEREAKQKLGQSITPEVAAAMGLSGVAGAVAGATGLERVAAGMRGPGRVLSTAGTEIGTEFVQGATEQLGQNIAVGGELPDTPLARDMLLSGAQEAVVAGPGAAIAGAMSRPPPVDNTGLLDTPAPAPTPVDAGTPFAGRTVEESIRLAADEINKADRMSEDVLQRTRSFVEREIDDAQKQMRDQAFEILNAPVAAPTAPTAGPAAAAEPGILNQVATQRVEQTEAPAQAQGLDARQPTALELAFKAALEQRQQPTTASAPAPVQTQAATPSQTQTAAPAAKAAKVVDEGVKDAVLGPSDSAARDSAETKLKPEPKATTREAAKTVPEVRRRDAAPDAAEVAVEKGKGLETAKVEPPPAGKPAQTYTGMNKAGMSQANAEAKAASSRKKNPTVTYVVRRDDALSNKSGGAERYVIDAYVPKKSAARLSKLETAVNAKRRGTTDGPTTFIPVDTKTLPDKQEAADNGIEGATTLSRDEARTVKRFAAVFGKKVEFFRHDNPEGQFDGAIIDGDSSTIYLNADAVSAHHLVVAGHELGHAMRADAPQLYDQLKRRLESQIKDGQLANFSRYYGTDPKQVYTKLRDANERDAIVEEFLSDLIGNRAGEYRTAFGMFQSAKGSKEPNLVYKIGQYVLDFIDALLAKTSFNKFATDTFVSDIRKVRREVRTALKEYAKERNAQSKTPAKGSEVDAAANEAATSPENPEPNPTEAEKEAGNYRKGKAKISGIDISIENPAGSSRRPEWPPLKDHYGDIKRTEGFDAPDSVDVFIKPGTDPDWSGPVFVVDQVDPKTRKFDEHKVMLGYDSAAAARSAYLRNYEKGWKGLDNVRELSMDAFKQWVYSDGPSEGAIAQQPVVKESAARNENWYQAKTAKDGTLVVTGNVERIRNALPDGVRGRVASGAVVFTMNDASRVKAALAGDAVTYSRQGEVVQKWPTKNGKYIGAPSGYDTPGKITAWRNKLRGLTEEGAPGRMWYENSGRTILNMTGGDVEEARKFVALLAIYSPQAKVDANSTFALRAWAQYKAGQPIKVKTGSQDRQATEVLYDNKQWGGEKTNNFFMNLMREIDPSTQNAQGATIDMWMMRAGRYQNDAPTKSQYAFMENETNRLAKEFGWEPQQVQAAIWVAMKARMENKGVKQRTEAKSEKRNWIEFVTDGKGKKVRKILDAEKHRQNWLEESFKLDVSAQDTAVAKFDFADGVRRHIGQVSWEARPGRTTGVLPGVNDAPYEQQVEFQQAVSNALYDTEGTDLLAQQLGLLSDGTDALPGVWQGEVAAGQQNRVAMAPAAGVEGRQNVDSAQAELLDTYASTLGWLLKQEGVGWHRPFYTANKSDSNGLDIDVGRPLTPAETLKVEKAFGAVMDKLGAKNWSNETALISSANGIRIVSFGAVDNKVLHSEVMAAVAEVLPDHTWWVFASSGNMVTNDWTRNPDGQEYIQRVSAAGRSDVLGWAADNLAPRLQKVFNEFSEKYGWGAPGQIGSRPDAGSGRRNRSVLAETVRQSAARVTSYGDPQDGATSVTGYHFSRQSREYLTSAAYGSGLAGAEKERLQDADPRLRQRVYFYLDVGKGVQPAAGVGGYGHKVRLNNLYDADSDSLRIARDTTGGSNAFELAVIDAGFDGYFTRQHNESGAAVLLGDHSVPVEPLGPTKRILETPDKVAPANRKLSVAETIAEAPNMPAGKVPGTRWAAIVQRTMPETYEALADNPVWQSDEPMYRDALVRKLNSQGARLSAARDRSPYLGDLTPEQERAARNVGAIQPQKTLQDRMAEWRKDLGLRIRQGMVDEFAAIKQVDPEAYMLARMSKASDGALEAMMLYGRPVVRDGVYDVNMEKGGFGQVLADLEGEHDRFLLWVAANRAERLKAEGRENLFTDTDISALKTLNKGKEKKFAAALAKLNAYNDAVLKIAVDSGLMDDAARQMFKDQPYVPFYRALEDEANPRGPTMSSGLVNQYATKKLKGGKEQLNQDLLANMMRNWSHLLGASAKNRAAIATMDAAEPLGIVTEVDSSAKKSVKVARDGVTSYYAIDDPYLFEAVSAMAAATPAWFKPFTTFKRWLTIGVTASPTFKIRNLIRDSLSAISQTELSYNPVKNVAQGIKGTRADTQIAASMLASGGVMRFGTMFEGDRAHQASRVIKKAIKDHTLLDESGMDRLAGMVQSLWEAYSELGDRAENANRAALYEQLKAKGYNHAEASFMARDLMDFSMSGRWPIVKFLTQSVPFMNARLQGLYKLGRAANENPKRFGIMAGAVSLASVALMLGYTDDEDWKKREDWDRDAYWWFKIGDTAFRIPKPFELGAIGTIMERSAEAMVSPEMTGKRYGERLSHMFSSTFAFSPWPQLVKPFVDIYANVDSFTGRPIESMGMERLRPEDRFRESTSEVARFLGGIGLPDPVQMLTGRYDPLSPVQIDSALRGYFGWAGTMVTSLLDYGIRPAMDRGARPEMRLRDTFLIGSFVESLPAGQSRYVTQMYEQAREINQAYASYRDAVNRGDADRVRELVKSDGEKIQKYTATAAVSRRISTLNRQAKIIQASKNMSPAAKRAALNRLDAARDRTARVLAQ